MIRKADKMIGTRVQAKNGEIGKIHDLYFSDDSWAIRYLIVDTGPWLFGRRVLIAPSAVQENSFAERSDPTRSDHRTGREQPGD